MRSSPLFALLIPASLWAQAALEFEVVTVKVSKTGNGVRGGCHGIDSKHSPTDPASAVPLGRCVITDARLSHLILIAYGVGSMARIKSGPDWIARGNDRYNIEAKAEDPSSTTEAQLLAMLQTLLIAEFKLKFHREMIEEPGFALVVGKSGHKLQPAKGDVVEQRVSDSWGKPRPGEPISVTAGKYSLPMLANLLSVVGAHPVIDKTGLTGEYDFSLQWDETSGPSLSTAIQEQLGLRFESQKVPVSHFIVDSAQKPAEN